MNELSSNTSDHDILIEVHTTLKNMRQDMSAMMVDHEARLRSLEVFKQQSIGSNKNMKTAIAIIGTCSFAISTVIAVVSFNK